MRQTARPIINPIIVDGYASVFNCTMALCASDSMAPLRKTLISGLGLDDMSLAWPVLVQLLVFITLAQGGISYGYSFLFIIVINFIFVFSL